MATWLFNRERIPHAVKDPGIIHKRIIDGFQCYTQDEYQIHGEMGMALPPFTAKFSKGLLYGHLLGVADEDGNIQLIDSRKTRTNSIIKGWSAHSNAIFDVAWVGNEPKLLTASGDQTARLWDVEKAETLGIFRGHTCSLKSINVQFRSSFVFATGARDGKIMIWDTRCHMKNGYYGPTNVIHGAHVRIEKNAMHVNNRKRKPRRPSVLSSDSKQSVTAVVFQDENIIISSGACDGSIKMWDIRKNFTCFKETPLPYHVIPYPDQSASRKHGYSSLILDSTSSKLYATCINDVIYAYQSSVLPMQPMASFYGHQSSTFYIKSSLSPDDRFLLSGSGDDNCYVFKVDEPHQPPWVLKGHVGEVTSVAWCPADISKIATCSDDNTFRIWRSFSGVSQQSDTANTQIGTCEREEAIKEMKMNRQIPSSHPTSKKAAANFIRINATKKISTNGIQNTPKTPASSFLDDIMSCTSASSIDSPDIKARRQLATFSTPKPYFESPKAATPSATPKNSRLILEKWLKTTPSPSATETASPEQQKPQRSALVERTKDNNTKRPDDITPKRKIVLCVRPLSEPQEHKRKGRKSGSTPLTKSSTKRKLVNEDKEYPPSKTIKTCFANSNSNQKSNDENRKPDDKKSSSPRSRRPFASSRIRDILDHVDETAENDEQTRKEESPNGN